MATIPIRIILHGLIALAPQNGPDGTTMTALLVDTPTTSVECYAKHEPKIEFPTSAAECTAVDECDNKTGKICICDLKNQDITILPEVARNSPPLESRPVRSLPFDREAATNFAYVANLEQLGYRLDRAFLSMKPEAPPPPGLAARFKFPFDTVAVCDLVTRRDDGADYVHATNMRPLGEEEKPGRDELSQAVAQKVEATVDVDSAVVWKLRLSPLTGQTGEVHEFQLLTDTGQVRIEVTNERPHFMTPDQLCDDGVGRDFAFFYNLVENKPTSWAKRPVPHVKYSVAKSFADLFPQDDERLCEKKKATMSRPICPMASFN